jgi:PAS domain S-box-containing protein
MGRKRKFVDAAPDESEAPRKSELTAEDESAGHRLSTTSTKRAAPSKAPKVSDAVRDSSSQPRPVEELSTSITISRPLDPTPAVETLPLDESFCPSGFNMLEILVLWPWTHPMRLGDPTD